MGAAAQRERQDELRHHPLRLRRNESAQLKNTPASGEHPGFVRSLVRHPFEGCQKLFSGRLRGGCERR